MTPSTSSPSTEEALISLGSNVEPQRHLPAAVDRLRRAVPVLAVSRVFDTPAFGAADAGRFWNAAVRARATLEPAVLKRDLLRVIEAELGRVRSADRNAPRTIDLDIAYYGDRVVLEPDLVIPDPEVLTRAHVALPLADVAGDWVHPGTGETLAVIAARLAPGSDIRVLSASLGPRPDLDGD